MGATGRMLIALSLASDLLRAGQTSTHTPQPVQSSGAIWMVYFWPFHSGRRAASDRKVSGPPMARPAGAYTLLRMVACGQTKTHLPHWMQTAGSQTGISKAIFLFSQRVVAVGNV